MKHLIAITLAMVVAMTANAQQEETWEEAWEEIMQEMAEEDENDEELREAMHEHLSQLAANPLELNTATIQDLEQIPFLNEAQVLAIADYRIKYGPMRSMAELKMIKELDYRRRELLERFAYVDDTVESQTPRQRDRLHSQLTATARVPFYTRKGDDSGYLGYKYRHSLRYELTYGKHVKAGLTGAQDAGEPFFANGNKWGYDNYSYYVQLSKMGLAEKVIVGKYKVKAGMGLVLGSSFQLGKQASLMSLGRTVATLRPHASRSEADYFHGAAATLTLLGRGKAAPPLTLTLFASRRAMDGTLAHNGTVTTLNTNGYHRTESEMERKHNTHLSAVGARLAFTSGRWLVAMNGVYTSMDRELTPPATSLYRRYNAKGRHFSNTSIDYRYTHRRLTVSGETAVCRDGAMATANSIGVMPAEGLTITALCRFYSYKYNGLYSHAFGNNSNARNESGLMLGATWNPLPHLHLQAYADYAHHPWARYLVSKPSDDWEMMAQAAWKERRWTLTARTRIRLRQRDNEEKTALTNNNEYRARLALTLSPSRRVKLKTQIDAVRTFYLQAYKGGMISQHITVKRQSWTASATAAFFNTDGYYSRLYMYERQMAYEFYSPAFFGKGMRLAAMVTADIGKSLRLTARLSNTNYFDRDSAGTGLQQTDHSSLTDLDLQLSWKL